jgi:hypothetical protein
MYAVILHDNKHMNNNINLISGPQERILIKIQLKGAQEQGVEWRGQNKI